METKKVGIIYCHPGFGDGGDVPFILSQLKFLTSRGYPVKIVEYGTPLNLLDDVQEVGRKYTEFIFEGLTSVVVYGLSRGAFVAPWSQITYPDLFSGTICVAGPTNLVTLKAIPGGYSNYFIFKYDKKESSPVNYGAILGQKPLLLIYGKADKVVPISQGMELAKVVKSARFYAINAGHTGVNSHPYTQAAILTWLKGIK